MALQITTMSDQHLEEAATLVARRFRAQRASMPLLPCRYELADSIVGLLRDLLNEGQGVVALDRGRLVGFLAGFVIPSFMGRRTAYSPDWANGAELEASGRIYTELYSHLAARWTADCCVLHAVSVLACDRPGIEAWQWLAFGTINLDAVRGLDLLPGGAPGAQVRPASAADAAELLALCQALADHVAAPPTFFLHQLKHTEEWLTGAGNVAWLACQDERPVGYLALEPGDRCDSALLRDQETVYVAGAFVRPEARGRGVAVALLNQALAWAAAEGKVRCAVDFETANPLAARFWPRWFQPVSYSLMRWVDERVVPASSESTRP